MTGPTLRERLRDAGLSPWELGDLLGIHPHLIGDPQPLLTARPVQVLIEIARRLDIHPADLVPELEPLLSHRRQALGEALGGQDGRADALTVLTALATARAPLSADQLARALGWQLPRTAAAIAAAHDNPDLGGSLALRRVPPETWTVTPRLDVLARRSAAPCATPPAPPPSTTTRPASCSPPSPSGRNANAATTPPCGHSQAGSPPRPPSRKPA